MAKHRFKITNLPDGQVEVTVTMPRLTNSEDVENTGSEARKSGVQWICATVAGLASACGLDLLDTMFDIYATVADSVDYETLMKVIREKKCTLESLCADPPEGIDAETVQQLVGDMLEAHVIFLDGHLKCTDSN